MMEVQIKVFFFVCLIALATAFSYDEECFTNFSLSFPTDPIIEANTIQVDIVHTFGTQDDLYQFRSRSKEVLSRGQRHVFHYNHPDSPFNPRNLTLFFDGSTVYGAMASFQEIYSGGTQNKTTWKCLESAQITQTFKYYEVSEIRP